MRLLIPARPTRLSYFFILSVFMISGWSGAATVYEPYLAINGVEVDPASSVTLTQADGFTTASFTPDLATTYTFGFSVVVDNPDAITTLEPGRPSYQWEDLTAGKTIRYPYDWTVETQSNVLRRDRLVTPGIAVDDGLLIAETRELFSIRIERLEGDRIRALFLKHQTQNIGYDTASHELFIEAGTTTTFTARHYADIDQANEDRFGVPPPLTGKMAQIAHRGWTAPINFSAEDYRQVARRFQGIYDTILIREIEPYEWIPPIFHEHGIQVLAYQYLGALRRFSSQVTPEVEARHGMVGAGGQRYTAPTSPDGAWLLLNIRDADSRQLLVDNARAAVEAGYDGIFLDGYAFWPDTTGRRGGAATTATCSLAFARWRLMREIKDEIRGVNPDAILSALGNQHYDSLGENDITLKELMYSQWVDFNSDFTLRTTRVQKDLSLDFETDEAPFVSTNLALGAKGYSPISVQTSLSCFRHPTGLTYMGMGDFYVAQAEAWSDAHVAINLQDDVYILSVTPEDQFINFESQYTLWADGDCEILFSKAVSVIPEGGTRLDEVTTLALTADRRYEVVHENRAPTILKPATQFIDEDESLDFSPSNAAAITILDPDATDHDMRVALSVPMATLSVSDTDGLTSMTDNHTSSVVLYAPRGAIVAAVNSLVFTPTPHWSGSQQLRVEANDLGAQGEGGEKVSTVAINIVVAAVADPPRMTTTDTLGRVAEPISLPLSVSLEDDDGSEKLEILLGGAPAHALLSAGDPITSGLWRMEATDLTGLTLTIPAAPAHDFTLVTTATATESGGVSTAMTTATLNVSIENEPPMVDLNGPEAGIHHSATITPTVASVPVAASDSTVADANDTALTSLTIRLLNPADGIDERLFLNASLPPGMAASGYDSETGTLTLSGRVAPSVYASALRNIFYEHDGACPNTRPRVVETTAFDGIAISAVARTEITFAGFAHQFNAANWYFY